jgi:hypothetical protein
MSAKKINKAKPGARKMRGLDLASLGPCWRRYE